VDRCPERVDHVGKRQPTPQVRSQSAARRPALNTASGRSGCPPDSLPLPTQEREGAGRQPRGLVLVGRRARRACHRRGPDYRPPVALGVPDATVSTAASSRDSARRGDRGARDPGADTAIGSAREATTLLLGSSCRRRGQSRVSGLIQVHVTGGRRPFLVPCWPRSRRAADPVRGRGHTLTLLAETAVARSRRESPCVAAAR
jgi:hypothetical protein